MIFIDAHGLEIQGRVYLRFLLKILWGGQGFPVKIARGGGGPLPILGFIAFLLTSLLKFDPPPFPSHHPVCIYDDN